MEDTSEVNPTDISYVHSIYAPLSIRLCEQVTKNGGLKHLQDVLGLLPGSKKDKSLSVGWHINYKLVGPTLDEIPSLTNSSVITNNPESPMTVLVFFIGGCTFAEVRG